MISYQSLLNIKNKEYISIIILPIIIIIIIFLASLLKMYDKITFTYIYDDNVIVMVPIENVDSVIYGNFLAINNQKYDYEIIELSEIQSSNGFNYQNILLDVKGINKLANNQLGTVSFYYNEDKIIKKILNIFFWKG